MAQLYTIDSLYVWPILIALIVLGRLVGRKASPDPDLLVEGGKYNRPFMALEKEPAAKQQLFKSWDEGTRKQLRRALSWDFLFIPIYVSSTALACFMSGRFLSAHDLSFKISLAIILLLPVAGLFDGIENLILWKVIDDLPSNLWLTIARISTVAKWVLIGLGSLHAIIGLLAWVCLRWLRALTSV